MAKDEITDSEWIITPGLNWEVDNFVRLYAHLKGKQGRKVPIMILGDRGVGKSLFVHIYEQSYKNDNKNTKPEKVIRRFNVASIPETLIESELFGYVPGAFTGGNKKGKEGLVGTADLLILEEIGELKSNIQAKLLTFIEDGKYYKVGDTTESDAKDGLQIIATTNKSRDEMRLDFYDRFIKFTVPPLYKRRVDIFYYMLQFAPYILPKLKTWEIMSLLAHPWPGNVREIEAVSMDMEFAYRDLSASLAKLPYASMIFKLHGSVPRRYTNKRALSGLESDQKMLQPLSYVKEEHTEIKWKSSRERYRSMQNANIDVKLLQKLMDRYDLGFDDEGYGNYPWEDKDFSSPRSSLEDDIKRDALLGTKTYRDNIFSSISKGLLFYRYLFWRDIWEPANLLSVRSEKGRYQFISPPFFFSPFIYIEKPTAKHDDLVKSILEYCLGRRIDESKRKDSLIEKGKDIRVYSEWIREAFHMPPVLEPEEDNANDGGKESKENPFNMKEEALLKAYYKRLIQKTGGNKTEAAKLAGKNYKTFYAALIKLEII